MKIKTYFLLLSSISILFFSCKKKENEELKSFDLDVVFQGDFYDGSAFKFFWTTANHSKFEKYHLVLSEYPIDENTQELPTSSFLNKEIRDQTIFSTNVTFAPRNSKIYCRLFLILGEDGLVASNVLELEFPNIQRVEFSLDISIPFPRNNAIYIVDKDSNRLIYYDFVEKEIKEEREFYLSIDFQSSAIGNNGFGDELYFCDDQTLYIFDANTLELKLEKNLNLDIESIITNENGFLGVALSGANSLLLLLERSTLSISNPIEMGIDPFVQFKFLSNSSNDIIGITSTSLHHLEIDDQGQLINNNSVEFEQDFRNVLVPSPQGDKFVVSQKGYIYDTSLMLDTKLSDLIGPNFYSSGFLYNGETILYGMGTSSIQRTIWKFSLIGNASLVQEKKVNSLSSITMFMHEEQLMIVGESFSGNTVIYPLDF